MALPNSNIFKKLKENKYLELLPDLKQEKTQKFTTIVLTLIALSFFGIFAINPTISTIVSLKKQLSDSQFTEQQLRQKIENLSSLGQQYQTMQQDIPYIMASLPTDPEISLLIGQIQSISRNSGVQLTGVQTLQVEIVTPKTSQKKYSTFSFSVSTEGSYENTSRFISSLINMQRVVSLDIIALNKKADQSGIIQLNIKGTSYFKN